MDTPGVKVAASYDLMVDDKPCEIVFDNVRVPAWKRIGKEGEGFRQAQSWLNSGRIRHGARSLGVMERCLELGIVLRQAAQDIRRAAGRAAVGAVAADRHATWTPTSCG